MAMKKKNKKTGIEEAVEVVNNLKASAEVSKDNEKETSAIKTLETSVRKIEKLKKEVVALKERFRNKKVELNQEKEVMWELVRSEKKLLKNKPQKTDKTEKTAKKEKPAKKEKQQKVEKPEETE